VPDLRRVSGNIAMPGFTAPKLRWVRDNEPSIFDHIRTVLLSKDYVPLAMTGDNASDLSDSAGTLSADVAELWGMARVPVAASGGDNAAGAAGVGVVRDGDALLSLGTSGVIFVAANRYRANPDRAVYAFCHALPGLWHQMSVHLWAASCVDRAARARAIGGARWPPRWTWSWPISTAGRSAPRWVPPGWPRWRWTAARRRTSAPRRPWRGWSPRSRRCAAAWRTSTRLSRTPIPVSRR